MASLITGGLLSAPQYLLTDGLAVGAVVPPRGGPGRRTRSRMTPARRRMLALNVPAMRAPASVAITMVSPPPKASVSFSPAAGAPAPGPAPSPATTPRKSGARLDFPLRSRPKG